jgi:hypothetical protein
MNFKMKNSVKLIINIVWEQSNIGYWREDSYNDHTFEFCPPPPTGYDDPDTPVQKWAQQPMRSL